MRANSRRAILCAAFGVLSMGFVPPKRDALPEIAGIYEAVGTHPDGTTYTGKGTIRRLGGERYEIVFDMPNGVFRALCLRLRDVLGCAWGAEKHLTVAVWRPTGAGIEGQWTADGDDAVGRESGAGDPFAGTVVTNGVSLDGKAYLGDTRALASGAFYRVDWRKPEYVGGWGLRVGSTLVGAFPSWRAGAAFYRIGPGGVVLTGEWMDPQQSSVGLGTEVLTR